MTQIPCGKVIEITDKGHGFQIIAAVLEIPSWLAVYVLLCTKINKYYIKPLEPFLCPELPFIYL